jgi:tryptophanyl-tRNA synthetase
VLGEFGGAQFSRFKPALADLAVSRLAPIAAEMRRLAADPAYIDGVLADGAAWARALAAPALIEVKDIVGLLRPRARSE